MRKYRRKRENKDGTSNKKKKKVFESGNVLVLKGKKSTKCHITTQGEKIPHLTSMKKLCTEYRHGWLQNTLRAHIHYFSPVNRELKDTGSYIQNCSWMNWGKGKGGGWEIYIYTKHDCTSAHQRTVLCRIWFPVGSKCAYNCLLEGPGRPLFLLCLFVFSTIFLWAIILRLALLALLNQATGLMCPECHHNAGHVVTARAIPWRVRRQTLVQQLGMGVIQGSVCTHHGPTKSVVRRCNTQKMKLQKKSRHHSADSLNIPITIGLISVFYLPLC